MNIPDAEKRRVKILTGEFPSTKIASLAACHPFTQQVGVNPATLPPKNSTHQPLCLSQLDIVFPSNPSLLSALAQLETSYGKGKAKLSDVSNNSDKFFDFPGDIAR